MIAITSISPGHKNFENQFNAIESWIRAGYKVVSLNSKQEIEKLSEFKNVEFVETSRTNERLFEKPYVIVSAIIDHLKTRDEDHFLIINSDILINDFMEFTESIKDISERGIIIMNRSDYKENMDEARRYELGFDGFFINKKWLHIFPQTVLCLGQCFWDYWVPYQAILAGVDIFKLNEPYLFHKSHPVQYSVQNWTATGEIFRGEVSCLDKRVTSFNRVDRMCSYVYHRIKQNLK
jgi:hypothetical protein